MDFKCLCFAVLVIVVSLARKGLQRGCMFDLFYRFVANPCTAWWFVVLLS